MTHQEFTTQVALIAAHVRMAGGSVEINHSLPYVAVMCPDGSEYFFQEHEADTLLSEVPDYVSAEDYILWASQGW